MNVHTKKRKILRIKKKQLEDLLLKSNMKVNEEILQISQNLDVLIVDYYKKVL